MSGRWMSKYQAQAARREQRARLREERERRMDRLVAWLSEHGSQSATEIRSVRETR
jgi:hypothetical protein